MRILNISTLCNIVGYFLGKLQVLPISDVDAISTELGLSLNLIIGVIGAAVFWLKRHEIKYSVSFSNQKEDAVKSPILSEERVLEIVKQAIKETNENNR